MNKTKHSIKKVIDYLFEVPVIDGCIIITWYYEPMVQGYFYNYPIIIKLDQSHEKETSKESAVKFISKTTKLT